MTDSPHKGRDDGSTHWADCWRAHHDCAIARVERIQEQQEVFEENLRAYSATILGLNEQLRRSELVAQAALDTERDALKRVDGLLEQLEVLQKELERRSLKTREARILELEEQLETARKETDCEHGMGEDARHVGRELMAENASLKEQLEAAQFHAKDCEQRLTEMERADNGFREQLEAMQQESDRLRRCLATEQTLGSNGLGRETELREQYQALLEATHEYVRVVNEHAEALADYAEDMDGDAEQIVSSLGFLGHLDKGCLDPEEDSLAQALDVLKASFPASRQDG